MFHVKHYKERWVNTMEEKKVICNDCGGTIENLDNALEIREGVFVCEECANDYCTCDDCGAIVRDEEGYYVSADGGKIVCQQCLIADYRHCTECGSWFPANESYQTHCGDIICPEC